MPHDLNLPSQKMRRAAELLRTPPQGRLARLRYYAYQQALRDEELAQHYEVCAEWAEEYERRVGQGSS